MHRPFRVGRSCDSWCTRCRAVTEHTIIAMVGKLPKRVQCTSCDGQHNYRDPAGSSSRSRSNSVRGRSRSRASVSSWQARVTEKANSGADSRNYSTEATFTEGDILEHPTFGLGVVDKVLPGEKIQVLFSSGVRLLAHNRD